MIDFLKSVDGEKIDMSLKKTDVRLNRLSFDELKVGMTVKGWVKRIDPKHGVFISLKDCNIVGLCHLSEVVRTFKNREICDVNFLNFLMLQPND